MCYKIPFCKSILEINYKENENLCFLFVMF